MDEKLGLFLSALLSNIFSLLPRLPDPVGSGRCAGFALLINALNGSVLVLRRSGLVVEEISTVGGGAGLRSEPTDINKTT